MSSAVGSLVMKPKPERPVDEVGEFRVVNTEEGFRALKDSWNNLLDEAESQSYFLRWEWLWAWWNAYKGVHDELCILLVLKGKELVGIGPFYRENSRGETWLSLRRVMFLGTKQGHVISEFMDVIYSSADKEVVVNTICDYLVQEKICDEVWLHCIEQHSPTIPIIERNAKRKNVQCSIVNIGTCPYIPLGHDFEEIIQSCSGSLRHKIRKGLKAHRADKDIVIRKTERHQELGHDFEELVRLHQLRWTSKNCPGSFSDARFYNFQKFVLPEIFANGSLELWFLSLKNQNIAALYNITYKNRVFYFQSGIDAKFDTSLSPGTLLHSHCIAEAIRAGHREYDLLFKGERDAYKRNWTKDERTVCNVVLAPLGWKGLWGRMKQMSSRQSPVKFLTGLLSSV